MSGDNEGSNENGADQKGAAVKFPPPLIFVIFMLVGVALNKIIPLPLFFSKLNYIGILFIIAGLYVVVSAAQAFKKVRTNIEPWKPTTEIVADGLFAYSRNPIYVAFCVITAGIGMLLNNFWILLSIVPAALGVYFIAIQKEERYLEEKFGQSYMDYKNKVRRWL